MLIEDPGTWPRSWSHGEPSISRAVETAKQKQFIPVVMGRWDKTNQRVDFRGLGANLSGW